MANDKQGLTKQEREQLKRLQKRLDLPAGYADILRQSVIFDWADQELVHAIANSDHFRQQYPGIFDNNGDLQDFLTGQNRTPLNKDTLAAAIHNYDKLSQSYETAAAGYGDIAGKITRDKVAALIRSETSPDELRAKLNAVQTVGTKKEALDAFNAKLKELGRPPLQGNDLFKFVAGSADQKFYDLYETVRLQQTLPNAGFSAQDAMSIAKALPNRDAQGKQTGAGDVASLVAQLSEKLGNVGPELAAAGIDHVTLARFLANPQADPGLLSKIQQIEATRKGAGAYVAGSQARKGQAGGIATYAQDKAANY